MKLIIIVDEKFKKQVTNITYLVKLMNKSQKKKKINNILM